MKKKKEKTQTKEKLKKRRRNKMDYETIWESEILIKEDNLPCVIVEKDNTYEGKNKYMVYEYDNGTHRCYSGEESKEKAIFVAMGREINFKE